MPRSLILTSSALVKINVKICLKCREEKSPTEFNKWYRGKDGLDNHCKQCRSTYYLDYYQRTLERRRKMARELGYRWRAEMISAYGGKCSCCGISEPQFLTIEHTNGGGSKDRAKHRGNAFTGWLRRQGWPKDGFSLLCYNCNCSKGFYGKCPHKADMLVAIK